MAVLASVASLHAVTFTLDTGGINVGGNTPGVSNNTRTFTAGSLTVTVTAWSQLNPPNTAFTQSYVGQYSGGGLGVTNDTEPTGSPNHTVDNSWQHDYLLFQFSSSVTVDKLSLGYVYNDSDLHYWIGSSGAAPNTGNILGTFINGALVDGDNSGGNMPRLADINPTSVSGNYLLVAANPSSSNDYFKVSGLEVTVPQTVPPPSVPDGGTTSVLLGIGLIGIGLVRRRLAV